MSQVVAVTGMLILGTATTACMKIMLTLEAPGWAGVVHDFDKPFMQSILMFFGMMFAIFIAKCWDPEKKGNQPVTKRSIVMASIPSAFDLFASTLMTFGLIYINASVFQMLRGSMVIFSAILSIIFLKKHIRAYEWTAIGITIVALIMIGVAGVYIPQVTPEEGGDQYSTGDKVLGSILVILSQLVQAGQIVTEEFILKDINMPALQIVGWEGIWGLVMMVLIACPFAFIVPGSDPSPLGTSLENILDSFIQLFSSGYIALVSVIFILAVMLYNIFGMLVTSGSSAVNRTILEAVRTLLIWIFMLICAAAGAPFGEYWDDWSWLELGGFVLLITGSLMYNAIFKLPFFEYPAKEQPLLADQKDTN